MLNTYDVLTVTRDQVFTGPDCDIPTATQAVVGAWDIYNGLHIPTANVSLRRRVNKFGLLSLLA